MKGSLTSTHGNFNHTLFKSNSLLLWSIWIS